MNINEYTSRLTLIYPLIITFFSLDFFDLVFIQHIHFDGSHVRLFIPEYDLAHGSSICGHGQDQSPRIELLEGGVQQIRAGHQ